MIAGYRDFENRIVAGDDLAFKRIGESNCCCSQQGESDETSHCEHFHNSRHIHNLYFATGIVAGCCWKARDLVHWPGVEGPGFVSSLDVATIFRPLQMRWSVSRRKMFFLALGFSNLPTNTANVLLLRSPQRPPFVPSSSSIPLTSRQIAIATDFHWRTEL